MGLAPRALQRRPGHGLVAFTARSDRENSLFQPRSRSRFSGALPCQLFTHACRPIGTQKRMCLWLQSRR